MANDTQGQVSVDEDFELVEIDSDYDPSKDIDNQSIPVGSFLLHLGSSLKSTGATSVTTLAQLVFNLPARNLSTFEVTKPRGRLWYDIIVQSNPYKSLQIDGNEVASFTLGLLDQTTIEQIEKDIPRTFVGIECLSTNRSYDCSRKVLQAIALKLPSVGYVQGMSFLASFLYLHFQEEANPVQACFTVMVDLLLHPMYNMASVFGEGLPNALGYSEVLQILVKSKMPHLNHHLEEIGLGSYCFAYNWIITLFTYSMPFEVVSELWTGFFKFGWQVFFKAFMLLLVEAKDQLQKGDFSSCFTILRDAPATVSDDFARRAITAEISEEHFKLIEKMTMRIPDKALEDAVSNGLYQKRQGSEDHSLK